MTPADHVRAAIDELDSEWVELRERLDEVSDQRAALAAWLGALEAKASPRDTPGPALPAGPTATVGDPAPSGGTPATPRPAKASAPKPRNRGGRGNKNDLAEIAPIARDAHAAGRPMRDAVAAYLGCGSSGAGQAITKARKAGHDIPAAPSGQAGARLRREAPSPPEPATRREPPEWSALRAETTPTATKPHPVAGFVPYPGDEVYVCSTCGLAFPADSPLADGPFRRHVHTHARKATDDELDPVEWVVV